MPQAPAFMVVDDVARNTGDKASHLVVVAYLTFAKCLDERDERFLCQISREILVARTSQRYCPDTRSEVLDEKAFGVRIA